MTPNQNIAPIHVLAISGSLRRASTNRKALQIAKRIAADAGAIVEEADLKDLALPIYDDDLTANGLPESVRAFRAAVEASQMLIIASPEHNASISAALKNALDWGSKPTNVFSGKTAAIMGVSGGPFGTVRMQPHLRQILGMLNVLVLPHPTVLIRNGHEAFTAAEEAKFADPKNHAQVATLIDKTLHLTRSQLD
jgi:chromate reductase